MFDTRAFRGKELIATKRYSMHKDDSFLWVVLIRKDNEFIVWTYNAQSDGFSLGGYFPTGKDYEDNTAAFTKAWALFSKRGYVRPVREEASHG